MRRKTLGVARVVRQPVQVFYMQTAAPRTVDAPTLVFQRDPPACQRQVADPAHLLVIAPPAPLPTVRANSCFFRLLSWMTRAYRSSNTPFNPGTSHETWQRKQRADRLGIFHSVSLSEKWTTFQHLMKSGYLFHTMSYTVFRQDLPTRIRVDPLKFPLPLSLSLWESSASIDGVPLSTWPDAG